MKENRETPKNKWSQIFRKKWFFPAVYLGLAALLLAVVVWYQNMDSSVPTADEEIQNEQEESIPTSADDEAEPVANQQEVIQFPLTDPDQAEIVTKFYDYSASEEDQESALVFYNNKYYQSKGIDVASEKPFDVVASLSGTVKEVKEDPLLGNVVVLTHGNEVMTYYSSLEEVKVKPGDEVKQGDQVGTAGQSIFGKDNGTHVHFEIRKDGQVVNPESFFNQPVSSLDKVKSEEVTEEAEANEDTAVNEEEAESDEAATEDANESEASENEEEDANADSEADSDNETIQ
ncbi:M23 family metallopeptidase [Oceanobacillus caeni]|uniref:M23 family metallopeptidase n=1 Tax=Bacillaceae TaxID=186817 RepID=UPI0006224579|nr:MULTISPECIES: M23 family metallopeptidase [Bacillaceae]KKE80432.1 stage II sporulation protein [Bacilli bacterium VT-13-104]PZD83367.1 M23 family peptidase [Bacilli bacterium]MBU8789936.1 M23 family metallopeptidase [Oceanobacillus caeni]MCR1834330.1 M23 family metallopeptidase [Oceanobacillus caeni]PZD84500.1 M23 family peptidase [Bacilli bacterium]